jgi:hypothetical protein
MSWKAIKKRILSKTYHVASVMLSIGVTVETYSPEIKQVVADKIGVSWGIAYAVMFALSMQFMREITKEPISAKGENDVYNNGENENGGNDRDVGDNPDHGSMDSVSGTLDDPAAKAKNRVVQGQCAGKRIADPRTKHRRRTKRRQ